MIPDQQITVSDMAFGGSALGRLADGRVCFVRGAAPGETVRVRMIRDKRSYVEAELLEILAASDQRIVPECPLAFRCPGCSYAHLSYAAELAAKGRQFRYFMTRGGLADPACLAAPFASPCRNGMRNRLKLTLSRGGRGEVIAGYRGWDNVSLIPVERCRLAVDAINAALEEFRAGYRGRAAAACWRWSALSGIKKFDSDGGGDDGIMYEELGDSGVFEVPCRSFFQTNLAVAGELIRRWLGLVAAESPGRLLELYCGVGVFGIAAARFDPELEVEGVELDPAAIAAARRNAGRHGVEKRCRFLVSDAGEFLRRRRSRSGSVPLVLLDPPRGGAAPELIAGLLQLAPATIAYISCAPDTLRRDLERLAAGGYRVVETGLLDMFPCTAHFESFTVLRKLR